ncbi:hypothetical protein Ciccas_009432, partial [Cichlidogyrus casuarinus]
MNGTRSILRSRTPDFDELVPPEISICSADTRSGARSVLFMDQFLLRDRKQMHHAPLSRSVEFLVTGQALSSYPLAPVNRSMLVVRFERPSSAQGSFYSKQEEHEKNKTRPLPPLPMRQTDSQKNWVTSFTKGRSAHQSEKKDAFASNHGSKQ